MNETLVERWNTYVKPGDHVYHLGDVAMCRPRMVAHIIKRLNGKKRLVRGNHDIYHTKEYIEVGFEEIYGVRVLEDMIFTHIPIHPASMARFMANVHGHIHNNQGTAFPTVMRIGPNQEVSWAPYINICVEVTNYRPVSMDELRTSVKLAEH